MLDDLQALLRTAIHPGIVRNALKVSAIVGTLLNLINQSGAVWRGEDIAWVHVVMNYVVPYCVASYSAARTAAMIKLIQSPKDQGS